MHPVSVQRMRKGGKLPAAHMCCQKQHSLATRIGLLIILQPVIHDHLLNIFQRVLRKVAYLRQLTSQRSKLAAQNLCPLRLSFFRKRHREVAHAHPPQPHVQKIDYPSQANANSPRQRPGQNTEDFDDRPGCRVLKSLPHRGSVTLPLSKTYLQTGENWFVIPSQHSLHSYLERGALFRVLCKAIIARPHP